MCFVINIDNHVFNDYLIGVSHIYLPLNPKPLRTNKDGIEHANILSRNDWKCSSIGHVPWILRDK